MHHVDMDVAHEGPEHARPELETRRARPLPSCAEASDDSTCA